MTYSFFIFILEPFNLRTLLQSTNEKTISAYTSIKLMKLRCRVIMRRTYRQKKYLWFAVEESNWHL